MSAALQRVFHASYYGGVRRQKDHERVHHPASVKPDPAAQVILTMPFTLGRTFTDLTKLSVKYNKYVTESITTPIPPPPG